MRKRAAKSLVSFVCIQAYMVNINLASKKGLSGLNKW